MYEISDSEDDCYDFTQQLQKLKEKHALNNRLNVVNNSDDKLDVTNGVSVSKDDSDLILVSDSIVDNSINLIPPESNTSVSTRIRRSKRKKSDEAYTPPLEEIGGKRGRGKRGRGRGRVKSVPSPSQCRRSGGRRGRTAPDMAQFESMLETFLTQAPRTRNRRGGNRRSPRNSSIVTYSVGNTDEYPDTSDGQELFSTNSNTEPIAVVDLDESLDNEELSVKVYWQHSEVFKFNIRRLQKLTQIFDFFVNKEGVSKDHLLFTYNYNDKNRILQPDDTPDSISYNIAKFIDGGIINEKFSLNTSKTPQKKGFVIKFQCQNRKKPVELAINKDEKLQLTMVKCAEHLEIPITDLVFEFDGETIQGSQTPKELDMENGDCIDVKILKSNK